MPDVKAWEGVAEDGEVGLTSNPKIAQLWRETGRIVTALSALGTVPALPQPQAATVGVTDEMVKSALVAYEENSIHMHRGWRQAAAMRAALEAALIGIPGAEAEAGAVLDPAAVESALFGCAQLLDSIAIEWSKEGTWSEWDQSIRDKVGQLLFAINGLTPPEGQKYGVAANLAAPPAPTAGREQALPEGFVRIDVATANQIINDTLEKAARVVEAGQETSSNIDGDAPPQFLSPRRHGNSAGLAYADAIRALKATTP